MEELLNIINKLKNESSRTAKESILKLHKDNQLFIEVLKFLLNTDIVTGISTRKINKEINVVTNHKDAINNLTEMMDYLLNNNTGKDYDVKVIQNYLATLSDKESEMVKDIATKKLKIGVTAKTVNKIYGDGTIPTFAVMLAKNYKDHHSKLTGNFYATLKLNGNRCVAMVENDSVKFFTRKGKEIKGMIELEKQMKNFPIGVYDGEIVAVNWNDLNADDLFRYTQKVIRTDGEKKDLDFSIFDNVSISEFKSGKFYKTYKQRRNTMNVVVDEYAKKTNNVYVLKDMYYGNDKEQIFNIFKKVTSLGFEGLMINSENALYQKTRTDDLLKLKEMNTADLVVVSIEKAIDGQFKGEMSRANVEYKGNIVGVGSGFSAKERKEFASDPDKIVGKIIEVQFFKESKDEKTGEPSLQFPVFKGIRDDKTIDDINYG